MNKIIRIAHRLGISPLMRRTKKIARKQQARLTFKSGDIQWERDGLVVLMSGNDPHKAHINIHDMERIIHFALPVKEGDKRVINLREPSRFRSHQGKEVWLPIPTEHLDSGLGYFAKGAPHPGDIAVDLGAYCGEITLELAQAVGPTGHVYALEPDPTNCALLQRNIDAHQLENVTVIPSAAWKETTELTFNSYGHYGSSLAGTGTDNNNLIKVSAISPADLFTRIGRVPDFIKMDIEGAEIDIMPLLAPLIAAAPHPMRLAIASYHLRENRAAHEWITPYLLQSGFQVETGYPEHQTTWAWR